jgi:hypothetical protein
MSDPGATSDAKKLAAGAIDEYREDLLSLQRLIALLDGLRPRLGSLDDEWLAKYERHVGVLDEIYALTQQSRWSRFGKRRRKIVRDEVDGLRSLLVGG